MPEYNSIKCSNYMKYEVRTKYFFIRKGIGANIYFVSAIWIGC